MDIPQDWHLPDTRVFGSNDRVRLEGDDACGWLGSLPSGASAIEAKIGGLGAREGAAWRAEVSYYRFPVSESTAASRFSEAYAVNAKASKLLVARRANGPYFACAMGPEICDQLLAGAKPRATATIEGKCYDLGDFAVRIGTFRHAATRTSVLAVRYRPLRPSHPAAREAETLLVQLCLGLSSDEYVEHAPLQPLASVDPDSDLDHYLNLVTCFRTTLYGASSSSR